jgi:hypothetical protein
VLLGFVILSQSSQATSTLALESVLAAGGLQDSHITGSALRALGLPVVMDVTLLNSAEQAELWVSLNNAGITLGERSRLRQLAYKFPTHAPQTLDHVPILTMPAGVTHGSVRQLEDQATGTAESTESDALSMDTLALAATALLGILSFIVQGRVAKAADASQKELELAQAQHEKDRIYAQNQLQLVRDQVADAIQPMISGLYNIEMLKISLVSTILKC